MQPYSCPRTAEVRSEVGAMRWDLTESRRLVTAVCWNAILGRSETAGEAVPCLRRGEAVRIPGLSITAEGSGFIKSY